MNASRPPARGFSLIESLAALLVFSIGALGVMQLNVLASQQNTLARSQTTASKIARDLADAFERLPFHHPLLARPTTLDPSQPEFTDFDNTDGRWTLREATALAGARPLLGAADAAVSAEGQERLYQVAWRSALVPNPDPERFNALDSRRIAILVRFRTPTGAVRQLTLWSIRYSAREVSLGAMDEREP